MNIFQTLCTCNLYSKSYVLYYFSLLCSHQLVGKKIVFPSTWFLEQEKNVFDSYLVSLDEQNHAETNLHILDWDGLYQIASNATLNGIYTFKIHSKIRSKIHLKIHSKLDYQKETKFTQNWHTKWNHKQQFCLFFLCGEREI